MNRLILPTLLVLTVAARAEVIGVETFEYPNGPIATRNGGMFWDYKNTAPAGHDGTPSTWDNVTATPSVSSGRLTTGESSAKREFNGPISGFGTEEENGSFTDGRVNQVLFLRASFTTGATLPSFVGLSTYDFGAEGVFFGKRAFQSVFGIETFTGFGAVNSTFNVLPGTTYTLVAKVDYASNLLSLYVNPDFNASEPTPQATIPNYTATNFTTAVRLASGIGDNVTWDNLVVATSWNELRLTVVTTATDVDDGNLSGSVSLREAVKYSPSGTLITFAPGLSGQTCALTHPDGDMVIPDSLTIDASALPHGFTVDGRNASRLFDVPNGKSLALRGLTLTGGNGTGTGSNTFGGAIFNSGTLTLTRCTLSGNQAVGGGGAVSSLGTLTLDECTLSRNSSGNDGGALIIATSTATLTRCTVSGNSAGGNGGAIFNSGVMSVAHSIVAGNRLTGVGSGADIHNIGGLTRMGTNLVQSLVNMGSGTDSGTAAINADPKLSSLGYFGGPTLTMHPLVGSPAVDAGGEASPGGTDQRGFPRFVDGDGSDTAQLDIGAVEAGPRARSGLIANHPVTTVADEDSGSILASSGTGTSLRELFKYAATGSVITFAPALGGQTITLGGTELLVDKSFFIDASNLSAPVTISGNGQSRVFNIPTGASVAMHSLRIINGKAADGGTNQAGQPGGGIQSAGSLGLFSCTVSGNAAGNGGNNVSIIGGGGGSGGSGGGIFSTGPLSLAACTVSGNTTGDGGDGKDGISTTGGSGGSGGSGGGIFSSAPLHLTSCTLFGNATGNGGNSEGLSVLGRPIRGDDGGEGGAIRNNDDSFSCRLTACTVAGNRTGSGGTGPGGNGNEGNGGGISGGLSTLQHCVIAQNSGSGSPDDVHVGSLTTIGANLLGTPAFSSGSSGPAPSIHSTPLLAPLGDYGGPTQTIALLTGSPAINAASASAATLDQRGFPLSGLPDLGAFEFQGSADIGRYWTTDWDNDGSAYGAEQALGTDFLVSDRGNPHNLTAPVFNAQGQASLTFGRNGTAAPETIWILKRSPDLSPGSFVEIYRFDGLSQMQTLDTNHFDSIVTMSSIQVIDKNPPSPRAFYRFEAVSP